MSDTLTIEATVIALVPEFHLAKIRTQDGHLYSLGEHTPGIVLSQVSEGQRYRCEVTKRLPRVLQATLIA
jgi:hypothetical protein